MLVQIGDNLSKQYDGEGVGTRVPDAVQRSPGDASGSRERAPDPELGSHGFPTGCGHEVINNNARPPVSFRSVRAQARYLSTFIDRFPLPENDLGRAAKPISGDIQLRLRLVVSVA